MADWKDEICVEVAPTMIQILFDELKENGYSDAQVVALSEGLAQLAKSRISAPDFTPRHRTSTLVYEGDVLYENS